MSSQPRAEGAATMNSGYSETLSQPCNPSSTGASKDGFLSKSKDHLCRESSAPYPDDVEGGVLSWLQVAGCFCLYWNSLGLVNTFGVFQTYYQNHLLSDMSSSAISWIGSIQVFFLMSVGIIVGPLFDAGYCRALLILGTIFILVGLFMTSICTSYWQVMLAHGICYFKARRARAMGIATVGSCLGATVYPLVFQGLQPRIGFPWAVRVLAFISLAMCCFSLAVLRPRQKPSGRCKGIPSLVDRAALQSPSYLVYMTGIFFSNIAWFVPVFYLQGYALDNGMSNQKVALYLVAILNAASIPGRLLLTMLSDHIGPINTFLLITGATVIVTFSWIAVNTAPGIISFSVFYGFFSGSLVAVAPVVLASFTADLSRLGTRLGMVSFVKGIGSLIGTPIAGSILGDSGRYLGVQVFAGTSFTITLLFMIGLRIIVGKQGKGKQV